MKNILSILLIFVVMIIHPVYSQTNQEQNKNQKDTLFTTTDEIIVTGTRTAKKLIDIPFSVNYLNLSEYKFNKNITVSDVLQDVPGINLQSRYGNHDVKISIRGFGSRSSSGIRGVRILLDGIPESEPDGQTRIEAIDFDAVGKIEIVKGNSSSLYTNAPGGVINFINNVYFPTSFVKLFSHVGSFDLIRSGVKFGVKSPHYSFLTTFSYHNYQGYRSHSQDYWSILNSVLQVTPDENSKLNLLLYYADGVIKLPGSLTLQEYESNSNQSAQKEYDNDYRRVTKKGRIGVGYNLLFGKHKENEIEFLGYGTLKFFNRVDTRYRIMTRYGIGGSYKFVNRSVLFDRNNEFSIGGDLFYQAGPVETFEVIYGNKTDKQKGATDEMISNFGFYFQDNFDIINEKLSVLLTGRYDNVKFSNVDKLNEASNAERSFKAFTPKFAVNYKITGTIAVFSSFGFSFDSPAANELNNFPLSSDNGAKILNPDLKPQKATNFEFGLKGFMSFNDLFLNSLNFEATTFYYSIDDEIVPFEINGSYFYRNSAKTNRFGIELGLNGNLFNYFKLRFNYTFSNFKYDKYEALTYDKSYKPTYADYSKLYVPSVPKHFLVTNIAFEKELFQNLFFYSKLNLNYSSDMFVDDANTDSLKAKSYSLLDFNLGFEYDFSNIKLSISGGVNNFLNKKYVSFININSLTKQFYESGAPRNYFGNISIEFML